MAKVFTKEENQAWSKTLSGKMCSACLAIRFSGKVLMVKAGYKDHWTFPSGIVDEGESPKEAALRETAEEIGVRLDSKDCRLLATIYTVSSGGDHDRLNFAFITDIANTNIELTVPNDEIEQAEWVALEDVTERSGNKASYQEFQKILTGIATESAYVETRPTV